MLKREEATTKSEREVPPTPPKLGDGVLRRRPVLCDQRGVGYHLQSEVVLVTFEKKERGRDLEWEDDDERGEGWDPDPAKRQWRCDSHLAGLRMGGRGTTGAHAQKSADSRILSYPIPLLATEGPRIMQGSAQSSLHQRRFQLALYAVAYLHIGNKQSDQSQRLSFVTCCLPVSISSSLRCSQRFSVIWPLQPACCQDCHLMS